MNALESTMCHVDSSGRRVYRIPLPVERPITVLRRTAKPFSGKPWSPWEEAFVVEGADVGDVFDVEVPIGHVPQYRWEHR